MKEKQPNRVEILTDKIIRTISDISPQKREIFVERILRVRDQTDDPDFKKFFNSMHIWITNLIQRENERERIKDIFEKFGRLSSDDRWLFIAMLEAEMDDINPEFQSFLFDVRDLFQSKIAQNQEADRLKERDV